MCLNTIGVGYGRRVWWRGVAACVGVVVVVCLIVGDESGEVPAVMDVEYGDGDV